MNLKHLKRSRIINDVKISYLDNNFNSDITILFIHGNSMNSETFKHQFKNASLKQFRLLAIDLPGHGQSEFLSSYSVTQNSSIIKNFCTTLELKNFIIVAHSLGGHFAIQTLAELKSCIGAFLIGTPPIKVPLNLDKAFLPHPVIPLLFKKDLSTEDLDSFAQSVVLGQKNKNLAIDSITKADPNFREQLFNSVANGDLKDEVKILIATKLPIVLCIGENDILISTEYINNLNFPTLWQSKVTVIEKASHSPHLDNPEAFNKQLNRFITSL